MDKVKPEHSKRRISTKSETGFYVPPARRASDINEVIHGASVTENETNQHEKSSIKSILKKTPQGCDNEGASLADRHLKMQLTEAQNENLSKFVEGNMTPLAGKTFLSYIRKLP